MALPETIPVRYTEEEAGYVTVRACLCGRRFRLDELLDMIFEALQGKTRAPHPADSEFGDGRLSFFFFANSWDGI